MPLLYGSTKDQSELVHKSEKESLPGGWQITCNLIDSAAYFYRRKDFDKMYDCYDKASMIPGGMTNSENFQAAILFSRVAVQNTDARFKSIALDFLNLLYLRHALSKGMLKAQSAFSVLYKEPRWESIYSRL